jgi:hypothetical protein
VGDAGSGGTGQARNEWQQGLVSGKATPDGRAGAKHPARVVPTPAKAEDAVVVCHASLPTAKASAQSRVGLSDGPKLKWIVEVVERGYLEVAVSEVA